LLNKKQLFVLLFVFAVFNAHSQPYYFRHYQVENGLSNNAVICSLQDSKGFLWFGTKDGLNRYDGYSFKVFRTEDKKESLGNNFIHSLYEDRTGTLWIGTEKGLYAYDPVLEQFHLLKGTENNLIGEITSDKNQSLWFIANFNLSKYNLSSKKIQSYGIDRFFSATSVKLAPDGTIWASSATGLLYRYNLQTDGFTSHNVFEHSNPSVTKWIEKIVCTNNGKILVGTSNEGAKVFDIATASYKNIITHNSDKTELFVRNFIQASADEYWIGTESGVYIYNTRTEKIVNLKKSFGNAYSISDNAVYTFTKDREGGIWLGTYFGGISYYPKQYTSFTKLTRNGNENSLSGNVVREVKEDGYGHLWIGTEDGGLNELYLKTGRIKQYKPTGEKGSICYSNIHGLLVNKNELWIGTFEHGLDVMDIKTGKVVRHYSTATSRSLQSNFVYCTYQSPTGEIMIGTTRGAYQFDAGKNDFTPLPSLPLFNWYTCLLKDEQGIIWATTFGNGINYYNTKTRNNGNFRYNAQNKNSIASDRVNCVFEDSNKNLWFATEGGLCKFNRANSSFSRYTTDDGLPSNFTISILQDDSKRLWISTTKGLVCFHPSTKQMTVYTAANGLLTDQFNFSSGFKDVKGNMYFGSAKGLISFHPASFLKDEFIPPVYITGFQINNKDIAIDEKKSPLKKSISYTDKIILPHNEATFSIDFAALSFTAPATLSYLFKMEGLDNDWTILKTNRKIYFTDLSPGTYIFKVKASNSSGLWKGKETQIIIVILPPWWRSWWAYTVYAIILALTAFYFIRDYHRRMEEKNRRKMELMEITKEKELYEAKMEFFTNVAHEIRTPLTLIKGPLEKIIRIAGAQPDISRSLNIMNRNTNRLLDLANQLLDFRATETKGFSLNFSKVNISDLLEETFNNFKPLAEQKDIGYQLYLPEATAIAFVDLDAMNKILYNLFSNALKYAKEQVCISLLWQQNSQSFSIEFKNDGFTIPYENCDKIFEPFYRMKETEKQTGTGIGLALARSLTQLHKGSLELRESNDGLNHFLLTLPLQQENGFIAIKEEETYSKTTAI
jgi:ligand-binding sensor domain-containing protein/signal transduction histidine kinase